MVTLAALELAALELAALELADPEPAAPELADLPGRGEARREERQMAPRLVLPVRVVTQMPRPPAIPRLRGLLWILEKPATT